MTLDKQCSVEGCSLAATVALDGYPLCAEHFVVAAYRFLDDAAVQLRHAAPDGPTSSQLGRRLDDCTRATTTLAMSAIGGDNLVRARLIDILLWAAELFKQVRRGPRAGMTIPVVLASPVDNESWEEKTETHTVSRHGASLRCARSFAQGDLVKVKRIDNGEHDTARVVWSARKDDGNFEVGLELLNEHNLWGVDWDLPEARGGGSGSSAQAR